MKTQIDLAVFFDLISHTVFGGKISLAQRSGIERILLYAFTHHPDLNTASLANILGQCTWETGRAMRPAKERGTLTYLMGKRYWPWIGYGLIQPTWKANYARFGITRPQDGLRWDVALRVMFDGMIKGMFTGKKLADYFSDPAKPDFLNARRIVNRMDQAHLVEGLSISYYHALQRATAE